MGACRYCRSHTSHSWRNSPASIACSAWPTSHSAKMPRFRLSTRFPVAHLRNPSMAIPQSCTRVKLPASRVAVFLWPYREAKQHLDGQSLTARVPVTHPKRTRRL